MGSLGKRGRRKVQQEKRTREKYGAQRQMEHELSSVCATYCSVEERCTKSAAKWKCSMALARAAPVSNVKSRENIVIAWKQGKRITSSSEPNKNATFRDIRPGAWKREKKLHDQHEWNYSFIVPGETRQKSSSFGENGGKTEKGRTTRCSRKT